jgi:cobalt-zinc-cadmium efflux system outer membrane protein
MKQPTRSSSTGRNFALRTALSATLVGAMAWAAPARADWLPLDEVVRVAKDRSLESVRAQGGVRVAEANMRGARLPAIGNPYLDLQIDRGSTTKDVQALGYVYVPIEVNGTRGARIDETHALVTWKKGQREEISAYITAEAVAAYGELVVAGARVTETTFGEQSARTEATYFDARLKAQDATVYEKNLADAEVTRWVQTRGEALVRLAQAKGRVSMLTGRPIDPPPAGTEATLPVLRGRWDAASFAERVAKSPLLAPYAKEKAYWEASVKRAEKESFAPVNLTLIGGRGDPGDLRLGGGFVFTFPVTTRNAGEIARAEAAATQVDQEKNAAFAKVRARVVSSYEQIVAVRDTVTTLDETGLPAMQRALDAAQDLYKLGKGEISRVLLARRDYASARAKRLDLLETGWRAYADLCAVTGETP